MLMKPKIIKVYTKKALKVNIKVYTFKGFFVTLHQD